jgi:WD40-like Beta Propeller Repeat
MRITCIAAAAGLALLAGAAPAAADSIAYVKDANIWVAAPDGSAIHEVTHDGTAAVPYRSPAEDDQGVIVAGHGNEIVRLRQDGAVLSHFDPPPAVDSTGESIDGVPQHIAISPDGTRIAFNYATYTCPPGEVDCGARQVLLYSYADRPTPVATFGEQFDLRDPSWIDDGRILAFGGHFRQVNIDAPGGGNDDASYWFDDAENDDLGDGELSRHGDRLAEVRTYGADTHIAVLAVSGGAGGHVDYACSFGPDGTLTSPTWSSDGRALAFAHADGIEVASLPSVVPGDCPGAASSRLVIPGGQEPDWSPAPVDPGTPAPPPRPAPAPRPEPAPSVRIEALRSARLQAVLRRGLAVRVTTSGAGCIAASAALGARAVGGGSARMRAAGSATVRIRIGRAGARALRRHANAKLAVRVTFTPAGGKAVRANTTVRVRR